MNQYRPHIFSVHSLSICLEHTYINLNIRFINLFEEKHLTCKSNKIVNVLLVRITYYSKESPLNIFFNMVTFQRLPPIN